jgi:putative ABC transport system ATP-binding protein
VALIVADGLTKTYSTGLVTVEALKQLTFTIARASFVSFVGPSGSGKTTLLNLIGGLDRPTRGRLSVADTDIGSLDRHAAAAFRGRTVGFIFQEFNLLPVLTGFENVEYPLLLVQHVATTERRRRVLDLLDAVGSRRPARQVPRPAVGRPEAAAGGGPGARHQPAARARRRADRQSRSRECVARHEHDAADA